MKMFIPLLVLFFVSCTTTETDNKVVYMGNDEIVKMFNGGQLIGNNFPEMIDEAAVDREKHLIEDKVFLTKEQRDEFEIKKSAKIGEMAVKFTGKGDVDMRSKDSPVESQWDGTCTAHGMRNVIDNKIGKGDSSTRHIWSKYRQYSCDAAVKATLNKSCITDTTKWPHKKANPYSGYLDKKHCNIYLTGAKYIGSNVQKAIDALDNGNPVYIGTRVVKSMLNCTPAINPDSDPVSGGHALAIVGYKFDDRIKSGGYFIVKNSWGTDCGDNGYQYLSFHHCLRKDLYCILWDINGVKHE